jgi:uncharacterized protein (DUF1800 family)
LVKQKRQIEWADAACDQQGTGLTMTEALYGNGFDIPSEDVADTGISVETVSPANGVKPISALTYAVPALGLLTAACGGGSSGSTTGGTTPAASPPPPPPPPPVAQILKPQTDKEAARFVLQSSLSVSETDISDIKSKGYEPWLTAQIDAPIAQTGIAWLASRGYDQITADNYFDNDYPGDFMAWNQLMTGSSSVRKRIALALSEYFVVSLSGLDISWRSQAIAHYWDQLNKNAFGNFRTLLEDITLNPAMGWFLSTRGNLKEDPKTGRQPDENYGREVMQLFTIGLYQLNNDGTRKLDASGQPIETYTNSDVSNLARVFTGYDWDFTGNVKTPVVNNPTRMVNAPKYVALPMTLDASKWEYPRNTSQHSALEAVFLGTTIPANIDGKTALKTALDALFNHANVAPFFCRQMIQRLITSNPSPAYVDRVAKIFNNNGSNVRGDLRAVFKAILLDDEAINASGLTNASFGKVREPMLRLTQWARTFKATSVSGNWALYNLSDQAWALGQSPLRSPSVFNFFRPGYVPSNTAIATNKLVAPEFQLVNETTAPGYVNFMTNAISQANGLYDEIKPDYSAEIAIAHDAGALLDRICLLLAGGQISDGTKTVIRTALDSLTVTQTSATNIKLRRVHTAILLVMASADYLVQK